MKCLCVCSPFDCRDIFVEQRISLDILLKLTDEKLRDMGVPLAVDRSAFCVSNMPSLD